MHILRRLTEEFEDVKSGRKTFMFVNKAHNKEAFKVGDSVRICEYNLEMEKPTGRETIKEIKYVHDDGRFIKEGFSIISF